MGSYGLAWATIKAPLGFARARVYHCRSCSNHLFINGAEKSIGLYSRHAPAQTVDLRHRAGAALIFLGTDVFHGPAHFICHVSYFIWRMKYENRRR
jgi:hypothetical protein